MGDHVYEKEFMEKAIRGKGLIGDRDARFIDKKEATKVICKNGRVEKTGKEFEKWDYIDTGFFILTPEIFKHAEAVVKEKDEVQLSEIIERAKLAVTEVSGYLWIDIDTKEDLKRARQELIKASVKVYGDGIVSRAINRKISTRISERIVDYITPNQVTILTFFLGVFSALLVFTSRPLAGILYQISSIIDGIDGEIARASMRESRFGSWMDSILDRYVDFLFLLALALTSEAWVAAIFAIFGSLMVSYSTERYKAAFNEDAYRIRAMRYLIGKRDERIFLIMLLCLFDWVVELLFLIALLTNLRVLLTVYFIWRTKSRN